MGQMGSGDSEDNNVPTAGVVAMGSVVIIAAALFPVGRRLEEVVELVQFRPQGEEEEGLFSDG